MAKHCETCKQDYPDSLASCPNCDAANLFASLQAPGGAPAGGSTEKATMLSTAGGKPTMMAPGGGKPTMMVPGGHQTQLAPPDSGAIDLPPDESETIALPHGTKPRTEGSMLAGGPGSAAADVPVDPKKTMLAKAGPKSTVLAPDDQPAMPFPPGDEKKTMLGRTAQPTMLARTPQTTQLAPGETTPMGMPEGEPKKTQLAPRPGSTVLAPPGEEGPMDLPTGEQKKTMLAPRPGATVLAPDSESGPMDLPPGAPKKTMLPSRTGSTILAPEDDLSAEVGADVREAPRGELARDLLEGEAALGAAAPAGMADSSTQYETADDLRSRRPQPKGGKGGLIGGGILGLLIGAAACVGVLYLGLVPPEYLKEIGLAPAKPPVADAGGLDKARQFLSNGQFQNALDNAGGDEPAARAIRGEAAFMLALQEKGKSLKEEDVKEAIVDLDEAKGKDARALLFLGYAKEFFKKDDEARKLYEGGKTSFPDQKNMFEGALNRLDAKAAPAAAPKAMAPLPANIELALMLVAATTDADANEAGTDFWKAAALARKQNYDEAVKALAEAKTKHDKRRFTNLRKPQNPTSDPAEEIFLRACDELETYWKVQAALKSGGIDTAKGTEDAVKTLITNAKDPDKALKEVLDAAIEKGLLDKDAKAGDLKLAIDKFAANKKTVDTFKEGLKNAKGKYGEDVDKAIELVLKDADVAIQVGDALKKAEVDEGTTLKGVDFLIVEHGWITDGLKALIENEYLPPGSKRDQFPMGLDKAIEAGRSPLVRALSNTAKHLGYLGNDSVIGGMIHSDFAGRTLASEAKAAEMLARLGMSRTPSDMLSFWLPMLERRERKEILEAAHLDAKRVLDEKNATALMKAHAQCVEGLALRNEGKFEDARAAIAEALKVKPAAKEGFWREYALRASKELNDPTAYYLPRGEKLISSGDLNEAVELLNAGVECFPNDGRVAALRSVALLDQTLQNAKGRVTAKDLEQSRKDAATAIKAGAALEGNYAAGRIAEELGRREDAEKYYNAALEASRNNARAAARIRVALGRVLLQMAPPKPGQKEGEALPMPNKVGQAAPANGQDKMALVAAALLTTALAAAEDDLEVNQDYEKALRLGDEAIRAGNPEGYLIKGMALARKGEWTKGLQQYTEGLRRLIKPDYAEGLFYLVDHHPAFTLPDALRVPDPVQAEKHYATGLKLYFAGQYPQAEDEFMEAYRNNSQDARYLYFLGLSRLSQRGKRGEAIDNFQRGWLLERQAKPNSAAVGAALERVQGEARQVLNSYRQ